MKITPYQIVCIATKLYEIDKTHSIECYLPVAVSLLRKARRHLRDAILREDNE